MEFNVFLKEQSSILFGLSPNFEFLKIHTTQPFPMSIDTFLPVKMRSFFFLLFLPLLFSDCRPEDKESDFVTLLFRINHKAGNKALVKDQYNFQNSFGQVYSVQSLDYYLSNVKLRNPGLNLEFAEVASYHLVNALSNPGNTEIIIRNVPKKKFTELEFSIGVDSVANSKTDQIGDLDPANGGMVWNWTTGYKFFAMTGRWQDGSSQKPLVFHIGENPTYKTLVFKFNDLLGTSFDIQKSGAVNLEFDLNEAFQSPDSIDFRSTFDVHSLNTGARKIADNYAQGLFKMVGVQ
jgi:hypothetical protein